MPSLIGTSAPDFTAEAVLGDNTFDESFNFSEYRAGRYGLLFFYPLDFTFVCPSEILAFDNRMPQFEERDVAVVAVSVDSHYTHLAWKSTPVEKGGLGHVRFPMVADLSRSIASNYGVLTADGKVAYRGTFLIDREGMVRHQVVNDLPLGRDVDEALRMVDALQFHEEYGEVCPAGWRPGKRAMTASKEGVADYLAAHAAAL